MLALVGCTGVTLTGGCAILVVLCPFDVEEASCGNETVTHRVRLLIQDLVFHRARLQWPSCVSRCVGWVFCRDESRFQSLIISQRHRI